MLKLRKKKQWWYMVCIDDHKHPHGKDIGEVSSFLKQLQLDLVSGFEELETSDDTFLNDSWERSQGGGGITRILSGGDVFEKVGIGYSHVKGDSLPESATAKREDIAGQPFEAMGVSLVAHPRSPMIPTAHMNVRLFHTTSNQTGTPVWWFGGGYDMTPYYGFREDCVHWHKVARNVCLKHFDSAFYESLKKWCDEYFYLPHRQCARGIGGLFFDDLNIPDFCTTYTFMKDVGLSFADAYFPIVSRRLNEPYSEDQRQFQLYRRGRYVEFNLVYDRGTIFGLQSGGRTESILMSMPPLVRFDYGWENEAGSWEDALEKEYLIPQDWANASMHP